MLVLSRTLGAVWLQACERLPALSRRGAVYEAVATMPLISGTSDTIPDSALWAASAALARLSAAAALDRSSNHHKGSTTPGYDDLPTTITVPHSQILTRLSLPHPTSSIYHDLICDYVLHNETAWSKSTWTMQVHSVAVELVELAVQSQEVVIKNEMDSLIRVILQMKRVVERVLLILNRVPSESLFHQSAESSADKSHSTSPSHLGLPLFQLLHTIIGTSSQSDAFRQHIATSRQALPLNIRAFLMALGSQAKVLEFVAQSGNGHLIAAWQTLARSYNGPQGLLSLYCQKHAAWRSIISRTTMPIPTGPMIRSADSHFWDESCTSINLDDDQGFAECTVRAKILSRSSIDEDTEDNTALVTLATSDLDGLAFEIGDRLLVMPLNAENEVEKVAAALGLESFLDYHVPLYGNSPWDQLARQLGPRQSLHSPTLTVNDVLRYGDIAPLSRSQMYILDAIFHGTCPLVKKLLTWDTWPVAGTLGDVLQRAIEEVSPVVWDTIFDLEHLAWLTQMIPVGTPHPYAISASPLMGSSLASSVKITVERFQYQVHAELDSGLESTIRFGTTSEALHPHRASESVHEHEDEYPLLIGVAPGCNLRLDSQRTDNVVMFASSATVGSFRGFWRARSNSIGQTFLFLTHPTQQRFPFCEELQRLERAGQMEVFAVATDQTNLIDPQRHLASLVLDQGRRLWDMLLPRSEGGVGGLFYVSGTLELYQSIVTGLRRALYNAEWTVRDMSLDSTLESALMEGRLILDIHPSLRIALTEKQPVGLPRLALHSGHRSGVSSWVAAHGQVYDVTVLSKVYPWQARTLKFQSGLSLDATLSALFVKGSSTGSMLDTFHVGPLAAAPLFADDKLRGLYESWTAYIQSTVKIMTAFAYESNQLLSSSASWFGPGDSRQPCFDFFRLQQRFASSSVSSVFGVELQHLHVQTAFAHVTNVRPDTEIPDVMGIISRACHSVSALTARKELQTMERLAHSASLTPSQADDMLWYVKAATAIVLRLFEGVREDACLALVLIGSDAQNATSDGSPTTTAKLLSLLERIASRVATFWEHLAGEGVGKSSSKKMKLRQKYDLVQPQMGMGVTFNITNLSTDLRYPEKPVSFAYLIDQAMQKVNEEHLTAAFVANHSNGITSGASSRRPSAYEVSTIHDILQHQKAITSLTEFLGTCENSIKRLSQLPAELSFAYIMSTYGKGQPASDHVRSSSAAKNVLRTMDEKTTTETPRPRLIRRRTNASSISSAAPRSVFDSPGASTPESTTTMTSSMALPFQLTLRARDRSSSKSTSTPFRGAKAAVPIPISLSGVVRAVQVVQRRATVMQGEAATIVESEAAPREQILQSRTLPALLPSPMFPDTRFAQESANTHIAMLPPADVLKEAHSRRKIDQVYSFSVSDGPAAGRPRTKHVDNVSIHQNYSQSEEDRFFDQFPISDGPAPKFEAPKRSRTVDRVFTHSSDALPARPVKEAQPKRKIDQIYSYSVSDGPAAGKTRTKYVEEASTQYLQLERSAVLDQYAVENIPPPRFGVPKASRVVDRIFSHAKQDLPKRQIAAEKTVVDSKPAPPTFTTERKIDATPTRATATPTATGSAIRYNAPAWMQLERYFAQPAAAPAVEDQYVDLSPGEWLKSPTLSRKGSNESTRSRADKALKMREISRQSATASDSDQNRAGGSLWRKQPVDDDSKRTALPVGPQRTMGYVGMWMEPASRIVNVDFQNSARLSRELHGSTRRRQTVLKASIATGRSSHADSPSQKVVHKGLTRGFVGLWMSPPSLKINDDFELVRTGRSVPQATISASRRTRTDSRQTRTDATSSAPRAPTVKQSTKPSVLSALWQGSTKPRTTKGYVGMWMSPASRIRNVDFEELRSDCQQQIETGEFQRDLSARRSQSMSHSQVRSSTTAKKDKARGFTLGSVGLWMVPPSKKINVDFEQTIANCMNYLLGPNNDLLEEMAQDFQKINAEIVKLPFHSGTSPKTRGVVVTNDATVPVQPQRCFPPPTYQETTLGKVGLWMYPPSQKRNLDFEGYRAAIDAMPLEERTAASQTHAVQSIRLPGATIVAKSSAVGYTNGFVGLWMDPPSQKFNDDFEAAKELAHLPVYQPMSDVNEPSRWESDVDISPLDLDMHEDRAHSTSDHSLQGQDTPASSSTSMEPEISPLLPLNSFRSDQQENPWSSPATGEMQRRPSASPTTSTQSELSPLLVHSNAAPSNAQADRKIDFMERMKQLNMELELDADGDGYTATATATPVSTTYPVANDYPSPPPLRRNHKPEPLPTTTWQEAGFEPLPARAYTPGSQSSSASTLSRTLSSPGNAQRPSLRAAQHDSAPGPAPQYSMPTPPPLRSQSFKQRSTVSNVRNMWEKRSSLVMDTPVVPLRLKKATPQPLKLTPRMNVVDRADSATIPGFEMLRGGGGMGGSGLMNMTSPLMSPMSPSVRAY